MSGIAFESLESNLKTLFSRVSLANWFNTVFCIFICSFPGINLFLISCNLFRFRNRLWSFSTYFYLFTNGFCSLLHVYHFLPTVSTCLPFLTTSFYLFIIYQSFLVVYELFLLVSTLLPAISNFLPVVSYCSAYTRVICNFQHKENLLLKNLKVVYLVAVVLIGKLNY